MQAVLVTSEVAEEVELQKLDPKIMVAKAGVVVRVTLLLLQEQTKSSVQGVVVVLELVIQA